MQSSRLDRSAGLAAASAPSRPTRAAVVGAGFIADFHLEILRSTEGVEVVAVVDRDRARAEAAARRFGVARAAALEELDPSWVDVAHVLVPPDLHAEVAGRLIERGIGAFVEKPLALESGAARALARAARERGVPLGVNHNSLFHPAFARLEERLRRGDIGRLEHVRICLSAPLRQLEAGDHGHWMFRAPRNVLFEQAPHPFAQLERLVGAPREVQTSVLETRELSPGQLFHARWLVAARGERATAEVYLSFGAGFPRSTIECLGSDGALSADLGHGLSWSQRRTPWLDFWNSFLAGWRAGGEMRRGARRGLLDYLAFTLGVGPRRDAFFLGMQGSIRAFHAALRAGAALPADGESGARVLEWCEQAALAAAPAREEPRAPARPALPRRDEVAVLGAAGFIGRRVVAKLLERGANVTAVVRRAQGLPPALLHPEVRLSRASLEDSASLREALRGVSCVVHLATGGGATWEAVERAMVQGSLALAEACLQHGVRRLIYVSSSAALYLGPDGGDALEDSPDADPRPERRASYARGKILAERALLGLHRQRDLPLVIVRPAVVLGPGAPLQHSGLGLWVQGSHCVGWGRGDTPLPLVYVDDVAEALVRLVLHPRDDLHGKALNLAADTGLTAAEVVAELRAATGRDLHFHPRSLALSQALEIGKWIVKKAGRRPGAEFPSWRDLKSRALRPRLTSRTAREVLGWKPVEERERFLDLVLRAGGAGPPPQGPKSGVG